MKKDQKLQRRIQELLEDDPSLSRYGLKARVNGGFVNLQGVVDVLKDKNYAEEKVRSVPGVASVENNLVLCTDGPIDDEDVAFEVSEELRADPTIPDTIGLNIRGGQVKLIGSADTRAQVDAAIENAQKARGVVKVIDQVRLDQEAPVDDATLSNKVENALNRLGEIARGISIYCHQGVVHLSGDIGSQDSIGLVEETLAHIPGVRRIRNHLEEALNLHDELVIGLLDRIGADPFLNEAEISSFWEKGQFVIEGEVDSVDAKKSLEHAIRDLIRNYPRKVMVENRVRVTGD